jgi:hypothetical protein
MPSSTSWIYADLVEQLKREAVKAEEAKRDAFDLAIGRLDRALSEFLHLYSSDLDDKDQQTLAHHANDLIGAGKKMQAQLTKTTTDEDSADSYRDDQFDQERLREQRRRYEELQEDKEVGIDYERMKFLVENPPWS